MNFIPKAKNDGEIYDFLLRLNQRRSLITVKVKFQKFLN